MPYNLDKMLDMRNVSAQDKSVLRDLQGNVLKGHGREHTANLFFAAKPGKEAEARTFLAAVPVTDALTQLDEVARFKATEGREPGGIFRALLLTAAGYQALGVAEEGIPGDPGDAFHAGMRGRQAQLNDPATNKLDQGFRGPIHGMLLIAFHEEEKLSEVVRETLDSVEAFLTIVAMEEGRAFKNANGDGVEHFGYVDGRSQPLMIVQELEKEAEVLDGITRYDPRANLSQVLFPDPLGAGETSFGSYFVFRKLEQNVKGFKDREEQLATRLGLFGADRERAGAMVVGRFEDGTPLVQSGGDGHPNPVSNNFDYDDDPQGLKCPFQAHIRKTNPRVASLVDSPDHPSAPGERSRHMARRGITYGERQVAPDGSFEDAPSKDVGLLFMSYQSSLEGQFEVIQRFWANNSDFINAGVGIDPVIGQGSTATPKWRQDYGEASPEVGFSFAGFVTLKGGEYFFAPSLSALKSL